MGLSGPPGWFSICSSRLCQVTLPTTRCWADGTVQEEKPPHKTFRWLEIWLSVIYMGLKGERYAVSEWWWHCSVEVCLFFRKDTRGMIPESTSAWLVNSFGTLGARLWIQSDHFSPMRHLQHYHYGMSPEWQASRPDQRLIDLLNGTAWRFEIHWSRFCLI